MHKDWFEDDNEIRLLRRGKRRLLDIVFGRTMVITLLLVLQIAIMVLGAHYLGRYYPALTIVLRVMSVAVIIYLVNKSGSATTKITWIILVMALPAFGVLLYLFVQLDIGHRYANRRVQESILSTVQYVPRQSVNRQRTECRHTINQHIVIILFDFADTGFQNAFSIFCINQGCFYACQFHTRGK